MDIKQEYFDSNVDGIKREIIECEEPKIEQRSDLSIKIDNNVDDLQHFDKIIKKERELTDLYVGINDFKQEFLQPKTENELFTLLTTHCDLPTLKDEITAPQFECDVCGKPFKTLNNLNKHFKLHTDENCEICDVCSQQFCHRAILIKHLKTHTAEKPFTCDICSRLFIRKENLDSHLKLHAIKSLFKCDKCSKQFTYKHNWKVHLKIHTGEKSFKCEICYKRFIRKDGLKTHLTSHTEAKPFKCEICSKQFAQKRFLSRHLKIHAREGVKV